jgi:outer membrane protein
VFNLKRMNVRAPPLSAPGKGARQNSSLPHECGVPKPTGTPHSCGRREPWKKSVARPLEKPRQIWVGGGVEFCFPVTMRTLLSGVVPGLLLVALLGSPAWAQTRIATVDMGKLFDNYYKTKQARAQLDERKADMENEHANMVEDWKKLKQDYQTTRASADDQAVSADEREKRKKLAEDKLKQLKKSEDGLVEYERSAQSTYQDQTDRVKDKVIEEIRSVLEAKAKSAGYALVLDVAAIGANRLPVILYHNDNDNDLTQPILEQLNAAAPLEAAKTPDKQPEKKTAKKKP